MLHHQLYDVKRKFADPRLAVTAQRNSTNIDAVDVVKRLQKSALRIMKRGTGPNFMHATQKKAQQDQRSDNYFDPLSVKNPLLQGEISTKVRSIRARSARILITSLKYYECHRITHSYHYTLKNNDLYYSLMSSNVTKYLTRASRSNTGTRPDRTLII